MGIKKKPFALITGVAGGIGSALVRSFKESGYTIIGTDLVPSPNIKSIDYFFHINLENLIVNEAAAKVFYEEVSQVLNGAGLKVLINNAALQIIKPVRELTVHDFRHTLNTNTLAPFILIQNFLKDLEIGNGSVINISSIHAELTKPNFVAYATSKAGLSGLTKALAVELGSKIRVNAITPGAIITDMLKAGFENDPDGYVALEVMHPVGRIGLPSEVAELAVFLASKLAGNINGAIFEIDGGISKRLHDPN
jgi:NAD(P)-dependent dehydrogenase (short-subunit alcohol dehydrogenase family)